jgi:Na+/pantothenate symporter
MFGMCGLVAYAVYESCDPYAARRISKRDQIIPYFVMDKMNIPGIPGIFLACVLSASLSTVSSGLNSLATVSMVDIALPIAKRVKRMK